MTPTVLHVTFLLSAIAIATADRVLGIQYRDEHRD
jgi:hypothetical protein